MDNSRYSLTNEHGLYTGTLSYPIPPHQRMYAARRIICASITGFSFERVRKHMLYERA